jgi:hypothetical protein
MTTAVVKSKITDFASGRDKAGDNAKCVSATGNGRFSSEDKGATQYYAARRTARKSAQREAKAAVYVFNSDEERFLGECVRQLLIVYTACGFGYADHETELLATVVRKTVSLWAGQSRRCGPGVAGCVKFMKYKLAAFYSAWYGLEVPPEPFTAPPVGRDEKEMPAADVPLLLILGRPHRFVLALFRRDYSDGVRQAFGKSVSGAKRGFPRPTDDMIYAAELATVNDLVTPRPPAAAFIAQPEEKRAHLCESAAARPFLVDEATREMENAFAEPKEKKSPHEASWPRIVDQARVCEKIAQVIQLMIPVKGYTIEDRVRPFLPSTRANIDHSREDGGAFASLMVDHPELLEGLKLDGGGVFTVADPASAAENRGHTPSFVLKTDELDMRFARLYARLLNAAEEELPRAKPVGLAEALKVRVITKGPPLINTAMLPLQKFLWKCLSRQRVTQLVGRPASDRALLAVLGADLPDGCSYLSGDYSAATNELRSWVSEAVASAIADRLELTQQERSIFLESLTGHFFQVIGPDGKKVWRPQVNGQLMGSVTSFPVLCLANIAVCWLAMEAGFRRLIPFAELRLLVNGDDCVFVANEEVRRAWLAIGTLAGLRPSLGKYFFTPLFAEINSTQYWVDENPRMQAWPLTRAEVTVPPTPEEETILVAQPFREVRWINLGLVEGVVRSGGLRPEQKGDRADDDIDLVGPWSLGSRHWDLYRTCPEFAWEKVNQEFHRRHHDLLMTASGLPWYLPVDLGGLGLVGVGSREDLMLARGAVLNWENLKVRPAPLAVDASWRIRQLAQRRLDSLPQRELSESEGKALEAVVGRLSVATLFEPSNRLTDLHSTETETKRAMLDANFSFWRYLRFGKLVDGRRAPPFGYVPLPAAGFGDLDDLGDAVPDPLGAYTSFLFRRKFPVVGPSVTVVARSPPAEMMYMALAAGFHLRVLQYSDALRTLAEATCKRQLFFKQLCIVEDRISSGFPLPSWATQRGFPVSAVLADVPPLEVKEEWVHPLARLPRVLSIVSSGLGLDSGEGRLVSNQPPPGPRPAPFAMQNFDARIAAGHGMLD